MGTVLLNVRRECLLVRACCVPTSQHSPDATGSRSPATTPINWDLLWCCPDLVALELLGPPVFYNRRLKRVWTKNSAKHVQILFFWKNFYIHASEVTQPKT